MELLRYHDSESEVIPQAQDLDFRHQFDHLALLEPPALDDEYYINPYDKSKRISLLMKLILCSRRYPETIPKIQELCLDSAQLHGTCDYKWTPLMIACRSAKTVSTEKVVRILINAGANVNHTDEKEWSVLMGMCVNSEGSEDIVQMLIDACANINYQDGEGWSPLMMASQFSNDGSSKETVKMLIRAGANVNLQNIEGYTALILACVCADNHSSPETVRILINAGADIRLSLYIGTTPLEFTCKSFKDVTNDKTTVRHSPLEVTELLLEAGARLSVDRVHCRKDLELEKLLLRYHDSEIAIKIIGGNFELFNYYLQVQYESRYRSEKLALFKRCIREISNQRNIIRYRVGNLGPQILNLRFQLRAGSKIDSINPRIYDYLSVRDSEDLETKVIAFESKEE